MKILALDLGTKLGWAYGGPTLELCGTETLMTDEDITAQRKARFDRRLDDRILELFHWLTVASKALPPDWIIFEDVQFASTTMQCQLWSSFRAVVWLFAGREKKQIECCPVGTLKKFATGHGGATKEMMAASLAKANPRFILATKGRVIDRGVKPEKILSDDAVDAVHLLNWGIHTLQNHESNRRTA